MTKEVWEKKTTDRDGDQLRQGGEDICEVTHFLFCTWLFVVRAFKNSPDTSCGSVGEALTVHMEPVRTNNSYGDHIIGFCSPEHWGGPHLEQCQQLGKATRISFLFLDGFSGRKQLSGSSLQGRSENPAGFQPLGTGFLPCRRLGGRNDNK